MPRNRRRKILHHIKEELKVDLREKIKLHCRRTYTFLSPESYSGSQTNKFRQSDYKESTGKIQFQDINSMTKNNEIATLFSVFF